MLSIGIAYWRKTIEKWSSLTEMDSYNLQDYLHYCNRMGTIKSRHTLCHSLVIFAILSSQQTEKAFHVISIIDSRLAIL